MWRAREEDPCLLIMSKYWYILCKPTIHCVTISLTCWCIHNQSRLTPTSEDLFLSSVLLEGSVMNLSVILDGFECFGEVLNSE